MSDIISHDTDAELVPPESAQVTPAEDSARPDASAAPTDSQAQTRYQQIQDARLAAERRAAAAEARAQMLEQGYSRPAAPPVAPPVALPKAADYETHDAWVEALVEHRLGDRLKTVEANLRQAQAQQTEQQQYQSRQQAIADQEATWKATHAEYDSEVALVGAQITPPLQWALMQSDMAPQLIHHLAQPEQAALLRRLGGLQPYQVAMELGRLEGRLSRGESPAAAATTVPKPEPPRTVTAARGSTPPVGYREDMSPQEYQQWRQQSSTWYKR